MTTDKKLTAAELYEAPGIQLGEAPESDAPAMNWLEGGKRKFNPFINGEFVKPNRRKSIKVIAPGDGRALGTIAQSTKKDVDNAVEAARDAQKDWAALSGAERGKYLYALARKLYECEREFTVLETLDNGKAFRDAKNADIPLAIKHLEQHAAFAQMLDNDPEFSNHDPQGVVGQIIPWNFPLLMLTWKIAPALATGNTVVLKPAEDTSLTALRFAELCEEVGLPKGVVNIITGDGLVGKHIVEHEGIDKIAFTGSTDVGRLIRNATAGTGKGLTLELGGKSPFIVMEDADLDSAVEGVVNAIWFNQGEVCCGGSRLLVQENIRDEFLTKLKARMQKLRVGGPLDKAIDMGAVVNKDQFDRINKYIEDAREDGAEIHQTICELDDGGYFIPPTLITNVTSSSTVMQEEIFGPVLSAMSFRDPAEAVQLANNTTFGLAASIWTEDQAKANALAASIKAGVIWINTTNQFDANVPFGGYRESGYGREGGKEGLYAYLKPQSEQSIGKADVSKPNTKRTSIKQSDLDLTRKFFVGGKNARPDGGETKPVIDDDAVQIGRVGVGNRKDIRNAVEAAAGAEKGWASKTGFQRGQVLRFAAENLSRRKDEFANLLQESTGCSIEYALAEVEASLQALFNFASQASTFEGRVHMPSSGQFIIPVLNEQVGVVGIAAPNEKPLLSFVTMVAAAMAAGNTVVALPSEKHPIPAMDMAQIFSQSTSDVPNGVVNIVTGNHDELSQTLAEHNNVDAIWYHGSAEGSVAIEQNTAASNLKQSWANNGNAYDWDKIATTGAGNMMRRATQNKAIWVPYGTGIGLGGGGSY